MPYTVLLCIGVIPIGHSNSLQYGHLQYTGNVLYSNLDCLHFPSGLLSLSCQQMIWQTGQLTQTDGATTNCDVQSNLDQTKVSVAVPKYMYSILQKRRMPIHSIFHWMEYKIEVQQIQGPWMGWVGGVWVLRSADMQKSQSFQIQYCTVHVVLKPHYQLNCNCVNFIVRPTALL